MNKKFFLIAGGVTIFILILVLLFAPKKSSTSPTTETSTRSELRPELVDLSEQKRNQTVTYVNSIKQKLPLYLESFETSVGITTSINIYRLEDDEPEIVRLEVYGPSYLNKNELDGKKNPNVTAFKESFLKAIEMLESQNVDPKKLTFIYGDKSYVRETTSYWVDKLGLLR